MDNISVGQTIYIFFETEVDGVHFTLAGSPAVGVYKNGTLTETNAGVTLTVDFDGHIGLHRVAINTAADGTVYSAGSDHAVVLTAGTVDGNDIAPAYLGSFSIDNRIANAGATLTTAVNSRLAPTVSGRTLDVTTTGAAGIDWNNIENQDATVALSVTSVSEVRSLTASAPANIRAALGMAAADLDTQLDSVAAGTTQPRVNKDAGEAYRLKISSMADGTYKATKPIRIRPGVIGGSGIPVSIDMSPQFGSTYVETVGTPAVESGGSLTCASLGPRDTKAMVIVDGTATASEDRTITVNVTMETDEVIPVSFDVKVFAE